MISGTVLSNKITLLKEAYFPLIKEYLSGNLPFKEFEQRYHNIDQNDNYVTGGNITAIKADITGDIRATYDNPDPEDPSEIGEDELRKNLANNLRKLESIVVNYENR